MSLPLIAIFAAFLYLVASRAGWLEALGRRPRARTGGQPVISPPRQEKSKGDDRLEVFEEFLRHLGRDDSETN